MKYSLLVIIPFICGILGYIYYHFENLVVPGNRAANLMIKISEIPGSYKVFNTYRYEVYAFKNNLYTKFLQKKRRFHEGSIMEDYFFNTIIVERLVPHDAVKFLVYQIILTPEAGKITYSSKVIASALLPREGNLCVAVYESAPLDEEMANSPLLDEIVLAIWGSRDKNCMVKEQRLQENQGEQMLYHLLRELGYTVPEYFVPAAYIEAVQLNG